MVWALKKNKGPQHIGKNVAGYGTKIHLILAKTGPISLKLTGANVHDSQVVEEMLYGAEGLGIQRFIVDKAYDDAAIRAALSCQKIKADIPPRKNRSALFFTI